MIFRANGIIVKSFATDFDALSQDGKMTVIVQNTGLVTADFYVRSFSMILKTNLMYTRVLTVIDSLPIQGCVLWLFRRCFSR